MKTSELWKQIEGTSVLQQQSVQNAQPEPINQRIYTPTIAQNVERGRQAHSSSTSVGHGFGGFSRTVEKRVLPSSLPSTSSGCPSHSKIPRVEQ
uniref:Uncharacterized protein n=1 Tax=Caenorhabditis tropicalis TaxID=1561998 RepID=A0A1I7TIC0_9PELO